MGKLPDEYIPVFSLCKTSGSYYFDTGIYPTNDTDVNVIYAEHDYLNNNNTYVFGARNTNSNTSAGQLNLLHASTSYFGYGSARASYTALSNQNYCYYFSNKANAYTVNERNVELKTGTATAATFTGTRTIYAMGLNNAGTVNHGSNPNMRFYYMSIAQGGQLVSELYPAKSLAYGNVGLYDVVQDRFITASGTAPTGYTTQLIVDTNIGGGRAFIRLPHGEYSKMIMYDNPNNLYAEFYDVRVTIEAEADDDYVFLYWTGKTGAILSYDRVLKEPKAYPDDEGKIKLYANFAKKSEVEQKNSYMLLGLQYGERVYSDPNIQGKDYDHYAMVRSFDVKEDGLTRTVSTIKCDSIPSTYQVNMPVGIFTSKGELLWTGLIETINDKVLTCREALSIYDEDFVFVPNTSWGGKNLTNYTLPEAIVEYSDKFFTLHTSSRTAFTDINYCSERKAGTFLYIRSYLSAISFDNTLAYDNSKNISITMPLISETSVSNFEEYLMDLFDSTGWGIVGTIKNRDDNVYTDHYKVVNLDFYYPNRDTVLTISDNAEVISNVDVKIETQEATVLEIYNSTGTTCRGVYGMKTDGTITEMVIDANNPIESFIAYNDCRTAVVLSDDRIQTLVEQYLSNSKYNHIITFDLDLTSELYQFSDFTIGRRVQFYYGNKVYESVVTGKEYALAENEGSIKTIKVTLGKVRKKLTDKINLSKASLKR